MEVLAECMVPLEADLGGFWHLYTFDTVDSTNTRIKEAIRQGAQEGTCFAAHEQTSAYGRQGRSWSSPKGGLYFSFILDPLSAHPEAKKVLSDLPALSLIMSLGIQAGLSSFAKSDKIKIKWPNDIVVVRETGYAKLCGISLETVCGKLCCGVGINVCHHSVARGDQDSLKPSSAYDIAYLEDMCTDRNIQADRDAVFERLLSEMLRAIMHSYEQWLQQGIEPLMVRYNELLFNMDSKVVLETIDGKALYEGIVLGVDPTGELLLKDSNGKVVHAASGEVHTRTIS